MFILHFLLWTLVLYFIHRFAHRVPILNTIHAEHHVQVTYGYEAIGWHWSNLFLYNDSPKSTLDLWVTEVLPTLAFSWFTGAWWISVFYYLWAAFIQERIEHDKDFDLPILTSGKWHMQHHAYGVDNFGLFIPIWDYLFGTYVTVPHEV